MEEAGMALPFNPTHPHDTLRDGLTSFKHEALSAHPVQTIQNDFEKRHKQTTRSLLEKAYGAAVPLRMDIDRKILSRLQRPPGLLSSSMLGLESLTGELDEIGFQDFLNDFRDSEFVVPVDMHVGMEARLGMTKGPAARTFL